MENRIMENFLPVENRRIYPSTFERNELKAHSCILNNNKYMIASTQITNTVIIAVTVV